MKRIFKYMLLFFFFLLFNLIINPLNLDEIWSYGFTNNIYSGLIPYKDFNVIITPLFFETGKVLFNIFGANYFGFHIYNILNICIFKIIIYIYKYIIYLIILIIMCNKK